MTSPIVTTGGAPTAGFNGVGLIFAQFITSVSPQITMAPAPTGLVTVGLPAQVQMRTPSSVNVGLAPALKMVGSAEASGAVDVKLTPAIGFASHNPVTAGLFVSPVLRAAARAAVHATLTVTPTGHSALTKVWHVSAAKTVTPTFSGGTGTPGFVAAATTIHPTITAAAARTTHASLSVTPTLTAGLKKILYVSAAKTITPTRAAAASVSSVVAFDAVGAGATGSSTASISWSHTAASGAAIIVAVGWGTGARTPTVTYNGTSMTNLAQIGNNNSASVSGGTAMFGLLSAGTGSAATVSVSMGSSTTNVEGCSTSYLRVSSFGTGVTNFGSSTSLSISATSATNQMVAHAFGKNSGTASSITTYNQTSRYNAGALTNSLLLGDAAGAATVSFTATTSSGTPQWGAVAVPLV